MKNLIGYSDFIRVFNIENPENFFLPGIEVRPDGVWVVPAHDGLLLTSEERATLSDHPKKDLTKPALSFPCSLKQLNEFFAYYGLRDVLDLNIEEKIAFNDTAFLPSSRLLEESQNADWQAKQIDWAIKNDAIKATHLVCIMAYDQSYISKLVDIWNDFQMDFDGDVCPDPSTFNSRAGIWAALFKRWTQNEIFGINRSNKGNRDFESIEKPLEYIERIEESDSANIFIRLYDLKQFWLQWELDSPAWLSEQNNESKTTVKKQTTDELILKYGTAAEKLYKCIAGRLKVENKTLTFAKKIDLRETTLRIFDANPSSFFPIERFHIEGDGLYPLAEKRKRQMIGMILKAAMINSPLTELSYQKLYDRFLSLKSTKNSN